MRLFVIFPCLLAIAWAQPLLKRKLRHNQIKERMFGVNIDCDPCGHTFEGVHTVQPMVMGPMPNVYNAATYNPAPQLYEPSAAVPSAGQIYHSQEYSSGQMTHHSMNVNDIRTHHFRNDKRPAPVLNYASQDKTTYSGESSSKLWEHVDNVHAASGAHKLAIVHSGDVDTFGAVPPVPAAPVWIEGNQYNEYSPLGYTGQVMDNSAAAGVAASAAHSSASAWSQQSGNYGPSNGHGVAFAHANSASWSSNNSG